MGEIVDEKPNCDVDGSEKGSGSNGGEVLPQDKTTLTSTFHPDAEDRLTAASTTKSPKPTALKAVNKNKEQVLSNQSSSSASSVIGLMALLGALVAIVGVAYLWNESRVEKAKLAYENNSLESELNAQRAQVAALQGSVESLQKDLAATQGYAEVVQTESGVISGRVNAIEGQIAEMTGASRVDWMLKEVEHFVMVAERRLSLLGDVDGALALVVEADELVRDMAEPAARPLRTAIQKDLEALTAASDLAVDTEGLFAQISLLNEKVAALKSDSIAYEMSLPKTNSEEILPAAGLEYAWYELKQFVKSLVRVQRVTDGEIKPLLLQDQQAFVEQNI
ncbi:MAG: uroporphyrinogen-III C-methyltransferase, partial [Pseudomonadales bacterium]|nr:uroporphyrinogen-III C-methyltransferase [Pseudomonadales bacterium]